MARKAVERFEPGLRRLVGELIKSNRRVILLAPMAMPGFRVEGYDQWISQCRQIVAPGRSGHRRRSWPMTGSRKTTN